MGRVVVQLELENYDDWHDANEGRITPEAARRLACEALVDTGASVLCLPISLIQQLGLKPRGRRPTRTAAGPAVCTLYSLAIIRVQGRECVVSVADLPDDGTPLLGQIPLQLMDWWVDLANERLVGNPEHGGEWQIEI